MDLYREIVRTIIEQARRYKKSERIEDLCDITQVSHKSISWEEMYDYPYSEYCTLHNPKYMKKDFLTKRIFFTEEAKKLEYSVNVSKLVDWLYANLPKEMYMTLEKLVFCTGSEEELDNLYEDNYFRELLEEHDLPIDGLGITWHSAHIVCVNLSEHINTSKDMAENDEIFDHEIGEVINYGILTTVIHEIRHLAQGNLYLPEEILQQTSDDETDAEEYARKFYAKHPAWILA